MADDKESWKRRREREDEADAEELDKKKKQQTAEAGGFWGAGNENTKDLSEKVDELLKRAEPMIEQLNSLYNQYFSGAEKRPPLERRKQLDSLMAQLQTMHKPTAAYLFRFNNLQAMYVAHRDRWDKTFKELEAGKLKRAATEKKKAYF